MKEIIEEYGDLLLDGIALAGVMTILTTCFFFDRGVFPGQLLTALNAVL